MRTKTKLLVLLAVMLMSTIAFAGPPGSGWNLVFNEDFNGNSLNTNNWRVQVDGEFSASNLSVGNGMLTIYNKMEGCTKRGAWLDTKGKRSYRYGYFECRLKHQWKSRDVWPTWWIWGGKPNGGTSTEFDICEWNHWTFDRNQGPSQTHHYKNRDGNKRIDGQTHVDATQWHTYSLLWTPTEVQYYVDGNKTLKSDRPGTADDFLNLLLTSSPDMHVSIPCNKSLPAFYIDYVKVWQGGNPGGGGGSGTVGLLGNNNKWVSSENGAKPMICNRDSKGAWEKFAWIDAGGGKIALKGSNGKYVSSENGSKSMTCNRGSIGAWEKFTAQHLGGGVYTFKGNNGKYVSSENGATSGMTCVRGSVGAWEKFWVSDLKSAGKSSNLEFSSFSASLYPNPVSEDGATLKVDLPHDSDLKINIFDNIGRLVYSENKGEYNAGSHSFRFTTDDLNGSGLYIIKVKAGNYTNHIKMLVR